MLLLILIIYLPYLNIAPILKYLCIVLLVYLVVPFLYKQDWLLVIKSTFVPTLEFNKEFVGILVGILGTTISPYLFFLASHYGSRRNEA
jgi:Mn2+/Fe2+ NRAMP family transporter